MTHRRPFRIITMRKLSPILRPSLSSVKLSAVLKVVVRPMGRIFMALRANLRPCVRDNVIDHQLNDRMRDWKVRSKSILELKLTGLENEK